MYSIRLDMRKVFCLLPVLLLSVFFCGCGGGGFGVLPFSGQRYWQGSFRRLDTEGADVSVTLRKNDAGQVWYEIWSDRWEGEKAEEIFLTVRRGPSLEDLGPEKVVATATSIDDAFFSGDEYKLAPRRGWTRPYVIHDPDAGYVAFVCVVTESAPGLQRRRGALLLSRTGRAGSWQYLGMLKGDKALKAEETDIDGGLIVRLDDGRWRVYLCGWQGFRLVALESNALSRGWQFVRNEEGTIRELMPLIPEHAPAEMEVLFPTLLRPGGSEWHLWFTAKWLPDYLWHYRSEDGLEWKPYKEQPEIGRRVVGGQPIKCLRGYLDPHTGLVTGLLSASVKTGNGPEWKLHQNTLDPFAEEPAHD